LCVVGTDAVARASRVGGATLARQIPCCPGTSIVDTDETLAAKPVGQYVKGQALLTDILTASREGEGREDNKEQ
jgi:hypothetical protein